MNRGAPKLENKLLACDFINLRQRRVALSDLKLGVYDLAFAFASFEPRCLAITKVACLSAREAFVFKFQPVDLDNDRSLHADEICRFFSGIGDRVELINLPRSVDTDKVCVAFQDMLIEANRRFGRPFSLLLDLTSCPKIYALTIIAFGLSSGLLASVYIFYAEGSYEFNGVKQLPSNRADAYKFTDGGWSTCQVPYLEGHYLPGVPRHAIVSMGAEAPSVEKLLKRYDPDRLTLLRPIPGASDHMDSNAKDASELIARASNAVSVFDVGAFDVVETINRIRSLVAEGNEAEDLSLFCFGTKPQAVAVGISGLLDQRLQVVCRIPMRYAEHKHTYNGLTWIYDLVDVSNTNHVK